MSIQELLEYLDGAGLIITDPDEIKTELAYIELSLDTQIAPEPTEQ